MRKLLIFCYMAIRHPILFFKYTIRKKSKCFLVNGTGRGLKFDHLEVGNNVRFGTDTRINFYATEHLSIGNNCYFGNRNSFLVGGSIIIEDNVLVASDVCFVSENHSMNPMLEESYGRQPLLLGKIRIKSGCWIGEKAIILQNVTIGEKSIIGAGSVVTKNVPDYCVAVGNPARIIKKYCIETQRWERV